MLKNVCKTYGLGSDLNRVEHKIWYFKETFNCFLTVLKNAIKVVVLDPIDIFKMVNSLKSSSK